MPSPEFFSGGGTFNFMDPNFSTSAPGWSLFLGSVGRTSIYIAVAALAFSLISWLLSKRTPSLEKWGARSFILGCAGLFTAMGSLIALFVGNRFEFEYVWQHADKSNAIPYRIAGVWAGQQGSFLLWACGAAIFGLLTVRGTGPYRRWFTVAYSGFLGALAAILAYETPYKLIMDAGQVIVPNDGVGLSPSLQNYWVTIHPPTIFLGFGALTVLAAYAFAATITGQVHDWIARVRPWSIVAMTLLGVGLCMGGFWAYETLGWGGFWMWDPVENVSFVPWVACAAFVHGAIVQVTKKKWLGTNLFLGALPFLLFVYGTFLTRSGVLGDTSVHSFANMDSVAQKLLLGFMVVSTIGFLSLWVWRLMKMRGEQTPSEEPKGLHREGFYRTGAILLSGMGIAAAIGMSVPFFMGLAGKKPSVVEEPIYHKVLVWIYVPLMLVMAAAPLVAWRGMRGKELAKRLFGVACVSLFLTGLAMVAVALAPWTRGMDRTQAIWMPFNIKLGVLPWVLFLSSLSIAVIVSNGWRITELFKRSKMSLGGFFAHIGIAVLLAGLIISRGFEQKAEITVQEGGHGSGLGYFVTFEGMTSDLHDKNNKALFQMVRGNEKWIARPGFYMARAADGTENPMVWPHIERHPFYDVYMALHPRVTETGSEVTLKPGESGKLDQFDVKYVNRTMDGQPGMAGTKFGAILQISDGARAANLTPKMELTSGGIIDHPAALGQSLHVSLKHIDAADGAATFSLGFSKPVYPIEIFFKPMTILVWLGTGMLLFSGMLAAWYRRRRPKGESASEIEKIEPQKLRERGPKKREKVPAA